MFFFKCYNLDEKERYRQLIDQNMCKIYASKNENSGKYFQNLVKTTPKEYVTKYLLYWSKNSSFF